MARAAVALGVVTVLLLAAILVVMLERPIIIDTPNRITTQCDLGGGYLDYWRCSQRD